MARDVGIARTLIAAHLLANGQREPLTFLYNASDPFAVTFWFKSGVVWAFARDLLADGVYGKVGTRVGVGDIVVHRVGDDAVHIILSSPTGRAVLAFERPYLLRALDATERLVPRGAEQVDVDAEIARLAGGAR